MLPECTFYFLRHGETDWNARGLMQGNTDIPLNTSGRAQAQSVRKCVEALGIETICASPLSRASETAHIVNTEMKRPVMVIDALREFTMGERDGTTFGPWFQGWRSGDLHIEGAETRVDFLERALSGLLAALEHPGPVLIVSHGGLFGAVKHYGRLDDALQVRNCDLVRLEPPPSEGDGWRCRFRDVELQDWVHAKDWM